MYPIPTLPAYPASADTARRLYSISLALQLSGAPVPDAARLILLARYVTGKTSLQAILPALEAPLAS